MKTSPVNDGLDRRTGFFFALNPVETRAEVRTCSLVCNGTSLQRREEKKRGQKRKILRKFHLVFHFSLCCISAFFDLRHMKGNAPIVPVCVSGFDLSCNQDANITLDALSYHTFVLLGLLSANVNTLLPSGSKGHGASECGRVW